MLSEDMYQQEDEGNDRDFAQVWKYLIETRRDDELIKLQNTKDRKIAVNHGRENENQIYEGVAGIVLKSDLKTVKTPSKKEDGHWKCGKAGQNTFMKNLYICNSKYDSPNIILIITYLFRNLRAPNQTKFGTLTCTLNGLVFEGR